MTQRHSLRARAGILLLAALLFVPLVLSGHSHAGQAAARSCAVCVATHHAPVASAPLVPTIALALTGTVAALPAIVAPSMRHRSPAAGRAPPYAVAAPVA